jgi:hypothetical protein
MNMLLCLEEAVFMYDMRADKNIPYNVARGRLLVRPPCPPSYLANLRSDNTNQIYWHFNIKDSDRFD